MTVPYACTLLEYCLVTGLDWWDLLVSLRPSMMDTVCERFTESFNRQPQQIQQFHYVQFLNIKTSLYRCLEILTLSPVRTITTLHCPSFPLIIIVFMSWLIYLIKPLIFNDLSLSLLIFICDIPLYYDDILIDVCTSQSTTVSKYSCVLTGTYFIYIYYYYHFLCL
jgi:hypothetical protein